MLYGCFIHGYRLEKSISWIFLFTLKSKDVIMYLSISQGLNMLIPQKREPYFFKKLFLTRKKQGVDQILKVVCAKMNVFSNESRRKPRIHDLSYNFLLILLLYGIDYRFSLRIRPYKRNILILCYL